MPRVSKTSYIENPSPRKRKIKFPFGRLLAPLRCNLGLHQWKNHPSWRHLEHEKAKYCKGCNSMVIRNYG